MVGKELQTGADALFRLYLQSVVFVVGVIAIVGGIDCATGRRRMYYSLRVRESKPRIRECRHAVEEQPTAIGCSLRRSKSGQRTDASDRAGHRIGTRPDGDFVRVIRWAGASKNVSPLIADIAGGDVQGRSDLP